MFGILIKKPKLFLSININFSYKQYSLLKNQIIRIINIKNPTNKGNQLRSKKLVASVVLSALVIVYLHWPLAPSQSRLSDL